ncbi:histone deacetylase 11 isoform X4 [Heterocephalus glaber]|uniref:Histone deacetylase 11 isoform X4 n=1 Tax=Heterocephalus glaber TaxID=10181 RepID=A0AAX6RK62_HETGA|nr:histone deacetylase 11 isoform X4 [Heterocephalus glaber]
MDVRGRTFFRRTSSAGFRPSATRHPAVPACTRNALAHRVLAALQYHLHGPGEAAPLRRWQMGQGDQFPKRGEAPVRCHAGGGSGGLRGGPAGRAHQALSQRAEVVLRRRHHHRNPPCHLPAQLPGPEKGAAAASDPDRRNHHGGGFHHCSSDRGGGFCAYADITLAIKFLFDRVEGIARATIIDLDAHQGNGHERDFMGDKRVYIMDVYNRHIYPGDLFAKQAIRRKVELEWGTEDDEYLSKVERNVERALREHLPDVVVYNAGTDVLEGDRLGGLSISPGGILKRDELVFRVVRAHQIPILMVTSGGYQKRTARIIADSILNLHDLGLIGPDSPSVSAQSSDLPPLPPAGP